MRVTIYNQRADGSEYVENVRYTDEIAESEGMDDSQFAEMEESLRRNGRFYLNAAATRVCFPL